MAEEPKSKTPWLQAVFTENLGMSEGLALASTVLIILILSAALAWFFYTAPPSVITITTGPPGSSFETNAARYQEILARSGVRLVIRNSQGAQENLTRLENPKERIDVGFVQTGITNVSLSGRTNAVVSLGSISYQPLLVFYRGATRQLLSQFKGGKLDIGPPGSGTRLLALELLHLNDLQSNDFSIVDLEPNKASQALRDGSIDALFLMGDTASPQLMRDLLRDPDIRLFDFTQADAYTRRLTFLNRLTFPKGVIDFGKDIPDRDVQLIGPAVELLARSKLHPALSDLLLEAAQEVNGKAGLMRRQSEFPAPLLHDFPISADALRFYKSGKGFTYRYLPFRLASLVNRFVVAFVPAIVVLIPGLKVIPALFRLRVRLRLYRWYRALLGVERDLLADENGSSRARLTQRLDQIDETVNQVKIPVSFADQFYVLRQNINFVRARLKDTQDKSSS